MEQEKFSFTVPQQHHPKLRVKLSTVPGVKLHNNNKPGEIAPPEAMGLKYTYTVDGDVVTVTITNNPHKVPVEQLKETIEKTIESLIASA